MSSKVNIVRNRTAEPKLVRSLIAFISSLLRDFDLKFELTAIIAVSLTNFSVSMCRLDTLGDYTQWQCLTFFKTEMGF